MKVFFDNCTTPVWSSTLNGFLSHRGHAAFHIRNLPCGPHATDIEWIEMLAAEAAEWIVITGDTRIQKNAAERRAYRQAALKGFVLAPAYQKMQVHQVASILLWRWPEVEGLAGLVAAPALFELPIRRSGKIRPLPL